MAEDLSEILLKEKKGLIDFLRSDKEFANDIKNHDNVDAKEIFSYDLKVEQIFNNLVLYGSWEGQSRVWGIINKNYGNIDNYHTCITMEKLRNMDISGPYDWDPHDSYNDHA